MAQTARGQAFEKYEPGLTTDEIITARDIGKNALSLRGKPILAPPDRIGFIAVKFALADGTTPTILLDEMAGRALWRLLQTANEFQWTAKLPGSERLQ